MIKNLTEGNVKSVLWQFSLPMFISVIFQQLYSIADSVIAGKFAGEDALAAVGASYPITMIFMAVAIGSNIGCSVVNSQLFGAKDYVKVKTAISTAMITSTVLSIILISIGLISSEWLMQMINTPSNIFVDGACYLKIYIGGFIFLYIYNVATGIFNSLGDSRTPLYFLIGSSIGNIILDIIFVAVLHMGVAGVAWATFIAQGLACVLALFTLFRRLKVLQTTEKHAYFSWEMLKTISYIAVPSILQQSFISIGNIFIQALINSFGSSVIAGYSAAIKLNTFAITSFTTLGNGLSSFTAQNIGAGKYERIKEGLKVSLQMALVVAIPFFIGFFVFSKALLGLFMNAESQEAVRTGVQFLRIISPFYFIIMIKLMVDGVLRGSGAMRQFMFATFADLILRVIISFVLAIPFNEIGIWLSWPIGWSIGALLSSLFYLKGAWRKRTLT